MFIIHFNCLPARSLPLIMCGGPSLPCFQGSLKGREHCAGWLDCKTPRVRHVTAWWASR